jgi:hypothetical protein
VFLSPSSPFSSCSSPVSHILFCHPFPSPVHAPELNPRSMASTPQRLKLRSSKVPSPLPRCRHSPVDSSTHRPQGDQDNRIATAIGPRKSPKTRDHQLSRRESTRKPSLAVSIRHCHSTSPPQTLHPIANRVLRLPRVKSFLITIGGRSIMGLITRGQIVGPWQVADVVVT